MTGRQHELRSILIVVLTVLSVFAGSVTFAGTAAAATNNEVAPADSEAGATTEYTLAADVTLSSDRTLQSLALDLGDADVGGVGDTDVSVRVKGASSLHVRDSASVTVDGDGNLSVTLADTVTVGSGDRVEILVSNVVNPPDGTYTGRASLTDADGNAFEGFSAAFEILPSTTFHADGEARLRSGNRSWQGQSLAIKNGSAGGATYELFAVTDGSETFVSEIRLDSAGETVIDTASLEGTYVLRNPQGDPERFVDGRAARDTVDTVDNASFSIEPQSVSASFDSDSIPPDGTTGLSLESNRAAYAVNVSSDDLSQRELQSVFGGSAVGHGKVRLRVSGKDIERETEFSGFDTGEYAFEFAVTDVPASDSAAVSVEHPPEPSGSFAERVFTEHRGDVAAVTVSLEHTDEATIHVGSAASNYRAAVGVEDDSGDGTVTLTINTFAAGRAASGLTFGTADSDDSVTSATQTRLGDEGVLDAATYDLNVTIDGTEQDVAALSVRERSTDGMATWTVPAGEWDRLSGAESIDRLDVEGDLTRDSTIAERDVVVHEVGASGIYGYLQWLVDSDAMSPETATEAFVWALGNDTLDMRIEETNPGPNREPAVVDLREVAANGNLTVVLDEDDESAYVALRTGALATASGREVAAGDTLATTFTVEGSGLLASRNQTASTTFTMRERELAFGTGREFAGEDHVVVEAAGNQSVEASTTVAAGTSVDLLLKSTGESPFVKTTSATVTYGESGNANELHATFDFSGVAPGTNFTARAREFDATAPGRVVDVERATVSFGDPTTDGRAVTVDSANLSDGGYVVVHRVENGDPGPVVGHTRYLSSGSHQGLTVELNEPLSGDRELVAVAHTDDGDRTYEAAVDDPYTVDGAPVADTARASVRTATPTPTATATATPPPTETPTATSTVVETPTTTGSGPGLGVAAALLALAGAALAAGRRD